MGLADIFSLGYTDKFRRQDRSYTRTIPGQKYWQLGGQPVFLPDFELKNQWWTPSLCPANLSAYLVRLFCPGISLDAKSASDCIISLLKIPAANSGATLKQPRPCLAGVCQWWSRKKQSGAKRVSQISDNLDKHEPDIQSDASERAGVSPCGCKLQGGCCVRLIALAEAARVKV